MKRVGWPRGGRTVAVAPDFPSLAGSTVACQRPLGDFAVTGCGVTQSSARAGCAAMTDTATSRSAALEHNGLMIASAAAAAWYTLGPAACDGASLEPTNAVSETKCLVRKGMDGSRPLPTRR